MKTFAWGLGAIASGLMWHVGDHRHRMADPPNKIDKLKLLMVHMTLWYAAAVAFGYPLVIATELFRSAILCCVIMLGLRDQDEMEKLYTVRS